MTVEEQECYELYRDVTGEDLIGLWESDDPWVRAGGTAG